MSTAVYREVETGKLLQQKLLLHRCTVLLTRDQKDIIICL